MKIKIPPSHDQFSFTGDDYQATIKTLILYLWEIFLISVKILALIPNNSRF